MILSVELKQTDFGLTLILAIWLGHKEASRSIYLSWTVTKDTPPLHQGSSRSSEQVYINDFFQLKYTSTPGLDMDLPFLNT